MRLFVFSVLLAGAVVFLSAVFFDANASLHRHLMWVLSSSIGGFAFIGFVIAGMEGWRNRVRQEKRLSFLRRPARGLKLTPSAPIGPASEIKPSVSFYPESDSDSTSLGEESDVEGASSTSALLDFSEADELQERTAEGESAGEVESAQESSVEREPADQVLYLVHDFEFQEVERVLALWQMNHEGAPEGTLGRWVNEDGTLVEVLHDKDGSPVIEIRGPMADELAEFLPQDLPVYPVGEQGASELI